ncbi:MAG: putative porin, partial [Bacteroidales bacterium]
YMPALQQFYLQDEKSTGNYPYIDAYIKFQVKRARIFVMFTHVNSGLMDYNYFFTPGYPMRDRYLKFGVSWFFHD